ncbi:hypothetical protein GUITHDRAFT_102603 [Guillardia theta CCMP2712]|uniref:1-alkyl-2-acetylglycerophosphocholine esterase n=1 Tax=Guillardia theta (strain CCMP2712) TaxID=905079 RepID=L1JUJ8_GUITC|nr:hypothetical protein GUITHDRAFT_102603 [Guillardia theta CCMP2712]EKX51989.1 hypothetical protein GUITHDRAFT_102603 [Guillardia theta CCMP2712]|eukprot:XP_005838969.1 hypothetical protein GUITHDRAFT_102603 [Guillardia theta CCMP2712]
MPFLTFPEQTGRFAVGQCDIMWQSRQENGKEQTKMVVRLFYPVMPEDASKAEKAAWLPDQYGANSYSYAQAYARFFWKPGITASLVGTLGFLPLMSSVKTLTYDHAPLAQGMTFKTIIYSHGLGGNRSCYSAVCTDLASHGYFVIAAEHSDGSACLSVLPDKTVVEHKIVPGKALIPQRPKRIPRGFTESLIPEQQPKTLTQFELRNGQLSHRVSEVVFLLDCIEKLNAKIDTDIVPLPECLADLPGRIEVDHIGVMGHSFGASTAVASSFEDVRIKACIAHDAWLFPLSLETIRAVPRVPTLFLTADTFDYLWPGEGRKVINALCALQGTFHQNYSDFPILAPDITQAIGVSGQNPEESMKVIVQLDSCFFDHYLGQGKEAKDKWRCPEEFRDAIDHKDSEEDIFDDSHNDIKIGVFTNDRNHYQMPEANQV